MNNVTLERKNFLLSQAMEKFIDHCDLVASPWGEITKESVERDPVKWKAWKKELFNLRCKAINLIRVADPMSRRLSATAHASKLLEGR